MTRRFQFSLARLLVAILLIATVVGCPVRPDFGDDTESRALTYAEYLADVGDAWFDPVGASDIYHRCYSTRDAYDAWWRFTIAEHDCDRLAALLVENNGGPDAIDWEGTSEYPVSWRPDDAPPTWWRKNRVGRAKSLSWCHATGAAERHHGWYLLYEAQSQTLYCWHWNHQWSSNECGQSDER